MITAKLRVGKGSNITLFSFGWKNENFMNTPVQFGILLIDLRLREETYV